MDPSGCLSCERGGCRCVSVGEWIGVGGDEIYGGGRCWFCILYENSTVGVWLGE